MVRTRINQSGQQVRAVIEGQPISVDYSGNYVKIGLNEHSGFNVITSVIDKDGNTLEDMNEFKNLDMNDRLNVMLMELRKINMQLSLLTDTEIKEHNIGGMV